MQSARLHLQSSELAPPAPSPRKQVLPPLRVGSVGGGGGVHMHSPSEEGLGGDNSNKKTGTLVLEVQYNHSTSAKIDFLQD
jgi:hypothetical protein